jgi:hypothetical protein
MSQIITLVTLAVVGAACVTAIIVTGLNYRASLRANSHSDADEALRKANEANARAALHLAEAKELAARFSAIRAEIGADPDAFRTAIAHTLNGSAPSQ